MTLDMVIGAGIGVGAFFLGYWLGFSDGVRTVDELAVKTILGQEAEIRELREG